MKRFFSVALIVIMVALNVPSVSFADNIYIIKVPIDATVIAHGATLSESNIMMQEIKSGRIHSIAQAVTGITFGYKYYEVHNLNSLDDVTVYDRQMVPLSVSKINIETNYIEYSNMTQDFLNKYSDRIVGAARAYHNRTGGYGSGEFYVYFQKGSDAAYKCEGSDSGRYWGQFVTARVIQSIEALEVIPYGNDAFTAKVRIVADSGSSGSYKEDYTISFLFQNNGTNFYVTNFTFMK